SERIEKDGKHIIKFKLKEGLTLSNGKPINTKAMKRSWELITSDEVKSIFRFAFRKIKTFKEINDREFELHFAKFGYDNLSNLVLLKILDLKEVKKGPSIEDFITSGPYRLKSQNNQGVVIVHNKTNKEIEFKVVKDQTTSLLKLMNNEVDLLIASLAPRKLNWVKDKMKGAKILRKTGTNFVFLNINHEKEYLKDIKFRRAIQSFIPLRKLIEHKFKSFAIEAHSFFSSSFGDLHLEAPPTKLNPEEGEKLLKELGFKKKEGFYYDGDKPISIDLILSNNAQSFELMRVVKSFIEQHGIKINLLPLEWGTYMRRYKGGQFDLALGQWVGFTDAGMLEFAFSSEKFPPKGANRGRYVNKNFEKLYAEALIESNYQKRMERLRNATKLVFEDVAYISLWHPDIVWLGGSCIQTLNPYSNGSFLAFLDMKESCHD
ncbi:MAG: ABC transporter substrate-binding protein, partial [Bacteriovoracaceae bacterium]